MRQWTLLEILEPTGAREFNALVGKEVRWRAVDKATKLEVILVVRILECGERLKPTDIHGFRGSARIETSPEYPVLGSYSMYRHAGDLQEE